MLNRLTPDRVRCTRCGTTADTPLVNGARQLPEGWEGSISDMPDPYRPVCPGCQYVEWHPLCQSLIDQDGQRAAAVTFEHELRCVRRRVDVRARRFLSYWQHVIALPATVRDGELAARPSFFHRIQTGNARARGDQVALTAHEDLVNVYKRTGEIEVAGLLDLRDRTRERHDDLVAREFGVSLRRVVGRKLESD
jgi:hypothetical protein